MRNALGIKALPPLPQDTIIEDHPYSSTRDDVPSSSYEFENIKEKLRVIKQELKRKDELLLVYPKTMAKDRSLDVMRITIVHLLKEILNKLDEVYNSYYIISQGVQQCKRFLEILSPFYGMQKPQVSVLGDLSMVTRNLPTTPVIILATSKMFNMLVKEIQYLEIKEQVFKDKVDSFHVLQHQTILKLLDKGGEIKDLEIWKKEFDEMNQIALQKIDDGDQFHVSMYHTVIDKIIATNIIYGKFIAEVRNSQINKARKPQIGYKKYKNSNRNQISKENNGTRHTTLLKRNERKTQWKKGKTTFQVQQSYIYEDLSKSTYHGCLTQIHGSQFVH